MIVPNLTITKTAHLQTGTEYFTVTYTLTATNSGDLAVGVVITDQIPTNAGWAGGDGSHNAGLVTWNIGSLGHNAHAVRTLVVTTTQSITNTHYAVSATGVPPIPGTLVTTVIVPNLTITKTATVVTTATHHTVTYTLTATNSGDLAVGVIITDRVPAGATWVSGGTTGGAPTPQPGDILSWTLATLETGEAPTFTFQVTVTGTVTNADYAISAANGIHVPGEAVETVLTPIVLIIKNRALVTKTNNNHNAYTSGRLHLVPKILQAPVPRAVPECNINLQAAYLRPNRPETGLRALNAIALAYTFANYPTEETCAIITAGNNPLQQIIKSISAKRYSTTQPKQRWNMN